MTNSTAPATAKQISYIDSLMERAGVTDGVNPRSLTKSAASAVIDYLKGLPAYVAPVIDMATEARNDAEETYPEWDGVEDFGNYAEARMVWEEMNA